MAEKKENYKKELKALKNISNTQLNEKDLEVLYYLNEKTAKKGDYESILTHEQENQFGITGDELDWLLKNLDDIGLLQSSRHSGGGLYRVNNNGIQLIRSIVSELNKGRREKLLSRTHRQSSLRPFISIVIAVGALAVAIFKN